MIQNYRFSFYFSCLVVFIFQVLCFSQLQAQTAIDTKLIISGEVNQPLSLSYQELTKMKLVTVNVTDRDGKNQSFTGVLLTDLLQQAGTTLGKELRGENLLKYVVLTSADGYETLLTLAEIDAEFTDQQVIVALQKNNEPLPRNEGPYRLIVPNDKRPARWIRELRTIQVHMHLK